MELLGMIWPSFDKAILTSLVLQGFYVRRTPTYTTTLAYSSFRNFIQRPLPAGGNGAGAPSKHSNLLPGALNRGIQTAVAVTTFFSFWSYIMPIFGGTVLIVYNIEKVFDCPWSYCGWSILGSVQHYHRIYGNSGNWTCYSCRLVSNKVFIDGIILFY